MKITIACVGKIKEKYLTAGIEEFSKRLTPFCKLETLAINEERMPDNPSPAEKQQVLERETQRLLAIIPANSYVILLDVIGKQLSSPDLAAKLDELVKARQEVKEGKYLGKIITGGKWYYAVSMDVANVERMHEGMTVTVRFDNVAGEQTMKVETIGDAKGDQKQVTVVFSSTRHLAETSLLRQQSAAVIYESYRGFRVPKEALRMEGDKYYLYRVSGAQLRKVEVEILCQLDDYYVVWQGKSVDKDGKSVQQSALEKAKQIRDGDTIVVRGMNLYDGKVVGSRAKT